MKVIDKKSKKEEVVLFKTSSTYLVTRTKTNKKGIDCNAWFSLKDFQEQFQVLEGSFDDVAEYSVDSLLENVNKSEFSTHVIKVAFDEGRTQYYDSLCKDVGLSKPYQYTGPKCNVSCKSFAHYETHHASNCPFYKGSFSERYDNLIQ